MNEYSQILDDVAEKDGGAQQGGQRIDISEQLLWGLYWGNCYTQREIAEIFGCDPSVIHERMKEFGIPAYEGYRGEFKFSNIQQQVFEGCMLGDGSMIKKDFNTYPYFVYADKHLEYLEFIQDVLGIKDISRIRNGRSCYLLRTRQLMGFNDEYCRWYPDGKGTMDDRHNKVIPHDLKLTPVSMLFWYVGDGSYNKRDDVLYLTNSLNRNDAEFLQKEIKRVLKVERGITLNRQYDVYWIRLNKKARNKFYELIKETGFEVPECYWYKFGYRGK